MEYIFVKKKYIKMSQLPSKERWGMLKSVLCTAKLPSDTEQQL